MHYNYDIVPLEVDSQPQALDVAERIVHHSQYLHYIIDDKYSSPLQPQAFGIVERITYHGQDLHHDNIDEENLPPLQAQAPTGVTERTAHHDQYSEPPCRSVAEGQPLNELHVSDDVHVFINAVLVNLRGVGWLQPPIHHRHLPSFDVLGLLHHQSHSDELISVDIDWLDTGK